MTPNLPWQASVQRAMFGAICVVILYHTLVAAPWLLKHAPPEVFRPAASTIIVPFFMVQAALFVLALMLERLTVKNLPRLGMMIAALIILAGQWHDLKVMQSIRESLPPGVDLAQTKWPQLHAISLALNAVTLVLAAVLYFKSRQIIHHEGTKSTKKV